jgi:hypothetical protein
MRRPVGISGICVFFSAGTLICLGTFLALLFPGSALEVWWRIKPQARVDFGSMGHWAPLLMVVVAAALATAAWGMWRGRRWGRVLAIVVLCVNGSGDLFTAVTRERTAAIGVIVAAALVGYLAVNRSVRAFFAGADRR